MWPLSKKYAQPAISGGSIPSCVRIVATCERCSVPWLMACRRKVNDREPSVTQHYAVIGIAVDALIVWAAMRQERHHALECFSILNSDASSNGTHPRMIAFSRLFKT